MEDRVERISVRVMDILEKRVFDDEAPQDLRSLLQSVQLLGELLKLQKEDGMSRGVRVIMEGDVGDYAK